MASERLIELEQIDLHSYHLQAFNAITKRLSDFRPMSPGELIEMFTRVLELQFFLIMGAFNLTGSKYKRQFIIVFCYFYFHYH